MIKLKGIMSGENYDPEPMKLTRQDALISAELRFHLEKGLSLTENVFRTYSEKYFALINEVRSLYDLDFIELNDEDVELIESDLGATGLYEDREVYLDAPIEEDEDQLLEVKHRGRTVHLNRPFRTPGGAKKVTVQDGHASY